MYKCIPGRYSLEIFFHHHPPPLQTKKGGRQQNNPDLDNIQLLTILAVIFVQDRNTFHRFDKFNSKYNPIGQL